MKKTIRRFAAATWVVMTVLGIWAFYYEPSSLHVREETIVVPAWPDACDGLTVAVLADLHIGSPYKGLDSLASLVEDTNDADPDLILLPGDFVIQGVVGGEFVTPEAAAPILARLSAPLGVYAVMGNHDWWLDPKRVAAALDRHGLAMMEDRSLPLERDECRFSLVGISDYWEGPHDVDQALAEVKSDATVLAFTHNPDVFPELPGRVLLTIAGHTHGGQVNFPLVGRPIVPSKYGQRYAIGHVVEEGKHLYVSPGVGTSILPVRFRVPPEVTVLEIRAE